MELGGAIRDARKATGLRQEDLGERVDETQETVSEWERGKRPVPLNRVLDIERALGLRRGALLVAAGYVETDSTVEAAIGLDPQLDESARKLLLAMYRAAVGLVDERGQGG